jgi:hypothetical protein
MHGHYADVSWHWSDDDAMTTEELRARRFTTDESEQQ